MRSARVAVDKLAETVGATSLPLRWALAGAAFAFVLGAIVGLVIGLLADPPTAWFAVFEIGIPVGALGAVVGGLLGALFAAGRGVAWRWP